ncbi:MAG TPA: decarboxylating 6-phosphogluconate dehydrogenase [Candidatus Paceibacterota bacterium]|jgi:6-phosphogluconate dehydrogenase|nr:decarboxylating 6-phosphogluconate dehydrogenase [Candidatus Paceibacterota bacterium]
MKKQIGYIGLGKMGKNMVFRLLDRGWKIVAYNRDAGKVKEVTEKGSLGASSISELVSQLSSPRVVWIMVSHEAVDEVLGELVPLLDKGDIIIDGGNSPYQETIRRSKELKFKGIEFLDIGVSGGPGGALNGACMMVGGKKELYDRLETLGFFKDTCLSNGWGYMGAHGAGHFVKMVHNGIEYGMMQSIAEGLDLLRHSSEFNLDLDKVTDVYSHGSVITSSLVSWMHDGYEKYGKDLNEISGRASASGEGKWTLEAGQRENISMPAIQASLDVRSASQQKPTYQGKVVSTMRGEFGQHPVKRDEDEPEVL